MSKPQHTPGPWSIDPPTKPGCLAIREGEDGFLIATVWKDTTTGLMEADANLISAAPDLLEACRWALSEVPPRSKSARMIRAAIRKAAPTLVIT